MQGNNDGEYVNSDTIRHMLPENAQAYYKEGLANFDVKSILQHHSAAKNVLRKIGLVFSFPINGWRIKLVRDGQIGLATYQEKFVFKAPGYQFVLDPRNTIREVVDIGNLKIIHGPKKLIRVSQGQLRFARDNNNGKPILLGPGTHYFDDPCIEILKSITFDKNENAADANNMEFKISDQLTFVRVGQGSKGIAYGGDGQIELLGPGLHLLEWPRYFHSHVSIKQEILRLKEADYLTLDSVEFRIKPALAYKLRDPLTAFALGITNQQDIENTLTTKATSALIQAMRQVNAREAGSFKMHGKEEQKGMPAEVDIKVRAEQLAAVNFSEVQDTVRKIFIESLQSGFGDQYGFEIEALDFNSFEYAPRYQNVLTKTIDNTIKKAELEANEAMLPTQIRIATATAEKDKTIAIIDVQAKAEVEVKKAEADAQAKKINAENEAMVIKIKAEAQAQAVREQAGAEAFKVATLGEAERQRLESIAKGQKAYAEAVGETTYGAQLAMAEVFEKGLKALAEGGNQVMITSEQLGLNWMLERFLQGSKNAMVPALDQDDSKVQDEVRRINNRRGQ